MKKKTIKKILALTEQNLQLRDEVDQLKNRIAIIQALKRTQYPAGGIVTEEISTVDGRVILGGGERIIPVKKAEPVVKSGMVFMWDCMEELRFAFVDRSINKTRLYDSHFHIGITFEGTKVPVSDLSEYRLLPDQEWKFESTKKKI